MATILRIDDEADVLHARRLGERLLAVVASLLLGFAVALSAASVPARQQLAPVATSEIVFTLDPSQSKVRWNVDSTLHTVHGTFALKSGTVHIDPETGKASGEIVVSAASGESGNDSRDTRMHKEILETQKYPEVVFRPVQVEGNVAPPGPSDVKLHGVFSMHGSEHELVASVHAELTGDHWSGNCKFEVPYAKWGVKDPSGFLLKVNPVVKVEVEMSGQVTTTK
jgi:polyisoprenoid-binding protein YceI